MDKRSEEAAELHRQAEEIARQLAALSQGQPDAVSPETIHQTARTLHELRVYQIELEMQNEELRRSRIEVEASHARYFDLYNRAPVGYVTVNEHGTILEANDTAAALLEVGRGSLIDEPVTHRILGEDQSKFHQLRRQVLTGTTERQSCELRMVKGDGTTFWAHLEATAALDEGGGPSLRFVLSDISGRQRMDDALRESEMRLRESQSIAGLGSYDLNISTGRWSSSDVMDQVFGIDKHFDRTTENWEALVHPEDRTMIVDYLTNEVLGLGRTFDKEYRIIRHNDQAVRWVYGLGKIEFGLDGQPVKMRGTIQDITDRKQLEEVQTFLAQTSSWSADEPFFNTLARYLANTLRLDFVHIDRLDDDGLTARMIANWSEGRFNENLTYALKDTPCGDLIGKMVRCFPSDVRRTFPRHKLLQDLRAESYVGVTLFSHTGRPIGLIAAIGRSPLTNRLLAEATLKLVAVRAAGELERLDAEAALKSSDERFHHLFRKIPSVAIQGYAPDGTTLYWNNACEWIYGYSAAEALGKNLVDLIIPPEMRETVSKAVRRMAETGEAVPPGELCLLRKDGSPVTVFSSHAVVRTPGREPEMFCIDIDLTELNRTEELLRESEARYRSILNASPDDITITDLEGHITMVSPAAHWMFGYEEEQLLGRLIIDFVIPEDRERAASYIGLMFQGTMTGPGEYTGQRADGSTFQIEANGEFIRGSGGQPTGMVFVVRDITARKRVEESHTRLATAVEQASETIVITDTQGTIVYVNPAFEKSTGYTCEEALGRNPRILKSGKQDHEFYRQMWETLRRGDVWRGHFFNQRKDGTPFEEEATISPVRDAKGKVVNFVAVKRDVTREVQLEAQFRQSQKMEAFGQLAGGVAHDFNNILGAIMLQAEVTGMAEGISGEVLDGLQHIRMDAERAADLTRQLLLFSHKQVLQSHELDLNEVISNLAKMLRRIIGEDVHIKVDLHPQPLITHADAGMLDQLMMNLVLNARDAMPGGGRILVETSEKNFTVDEAALIADAKPGRHACLSITDTGCGIEPGNLSRIFEPFFTTKEPGKGTGLGLATVFGIVKQHGGSIAIESEVGRGTTFRVFLPITEDAASAAAAREEGDAAQLHGTETILLVEDEPELRMLTGIILKMHGFQVLEAAHGVAALAVWDRHTGPIDLLLTDLVMPEGIYGLELAARLRERDPRLRVVFTSGYSADISGRELSLLEGQHFIQKPATPQQLLDTIRQCLNT